MAEGLRGILLLQDSDGDADSYAELIHFHGIDQNQHTASFLGKS